MQRLTGMQRMYSRRGSVSGASTSKSVSNIVGRSADVQDHSRKRQRRLEPHEEANLNENEPVRTHFKPNPDSNHIPASLGRNSKPNTSEGGSVTSTAQMSQAGNEPIPLTNFFKFTTKSLPKIEPMVPTGIEATIPKLPQKAHYNLHNEAEETSYVTSRSVKTAPIPSHMIDSDDDQDDEPTVGAGMLKTQRCFKKELVLTKFNFNVFKIPRMKDLAVHRFKRQIVETVKRNRAVVIEGFTGCGKTTQVPQFILDECVARGETYNIVVTQPRRIAAVSVARRVCDERGWEVGSVVGYQIGMEAKVNPRETMITYMTTGVLLQKLIHSKSLALFSHIIVDEVHERDLDTDFLLLVIKKILMDDIDKKERHVKVILMSATLNASKFSRYFVAGNGQNTTEAPIIKIPASQATFAVEEKFVDDLLDLAETQRIYAKLMESLEDANKTHILNEIYTLAVQTMVQLDLDEKVSSINKNDPRRVSAAVKDINLESRGSVLVFLPGRHEIDRLQKELNAENQEYMNKNGGYRNLKWNIVQLHSSTTREEQFKVFKPSPKGERKIILATNVAESSVTVSDVVYVLDFCLTKSQHVDSKTNYSRLRLTWASINQCTQRKGRTGRVAPGKVFRLVPRRFYSEFRKESPPEMKRSGIENVVLRVKALNLGNPKDMLALAIEPPPQSGIERAVASLKESGALTILMTNAKGEKRYDTCDGDLTFMGKVMSTLPISHHCARLIMLGHVFGVMDECVIIAAGLSSVKSPFINKKSLESYLAKLNWAGRTQSDCFAILYAFREWTQRFGQSGDFTESERAWATGNSIQISVMREIKAVAEELRDRIKNHEIVAKNLGFDVPKDGIQVSKEQGVMIKVAIAGAFYPNYFHRQRPDITRYENDCSNEVDGNDLLSTVYYKGFPTGHKGELYAKHIADRLTVGLDVPRVTFKGQRVFATFEMGEKTVPISRSVYRALKMEQLGEKMEFKVLEKDQEAQYLDVHGGSLRQQPTMLCPAQITLPGVGCPYIDVHVTHVENPGQFYIIYKQHQPELKEIDDFNNSYLTTEALPLDQVTPGSFCLAQYPDEGKYYRARIRAICPLGKVLVYFVDYGNSNWVRRVNLKPFSPSHLERKVDTIPALAVECRLGNIRPAVLFGSVWHHDAIEKFRKFVDKAPLLRMEIYCVVRSVIVGTLFGGDDNGKFDVNMGLVTDLYADRVEENRVCKSNNGARSLFHLMRNDPNQIRGHNKDQVEEMQDYDFVKPPNSHIALERMTLKGPYSPLELKFDSLCNSSKPKTVQIDRLSVNSVSLDQEPSAPISRLLVASAVVIKDSDESVSARDTTMMPAIPGLLALLSMTFTPKIELRVDEYQSKYTGVLCGLGMDPQLRAAVYQDHDVEVVFDTEITNADITSINKIRHCMNLILREPSGANLGPTHKFAVEEMFRLLRSDRKRMVEEVWPQESYVWNRIDPGLVQLSGEFASQIEPKDIFLPHSAVELNGSAKLDVSYIGAF